MFYLNKIRKPADVARLKPSELRPLADECRKYIIDTILSSGGHFAGNLGVVELTVALLHCMKDGDSIIWDVGHQSYVHKILSGRKDDLPGIRTFGGISGFPKRDENPADVFGTGHSSTAISAALGIAEANRLKENPNSLAIAVVGDGALTGGMAFEALNNAGTSDANILIVINDNHIGIDPNNGAIDRHLQTIDNSSENIFTLFGLPFTGPVDGHDIDALLLALAKCCNQTGPRILHVKTLKGKGYAPAEAEQTRWHSTGSYVKIENTEPKQGLKWHEVVGSELLHLAENNPNVVGITPAMPSGSGLQSCFLRFPNRFFDVGIAEQHAATFAAGMATAGMKPYLVVYSTFLQRAFDQVIHDIALQQLPVTILIDRAGLVGEDGPTHHGVFDIAYLSCIPGIELYAPAWKEELQELMKFACKQNKPIAIRYPKGVASSLFSEKQILHDCIEHGFSRLKTGQNIALVSCGMGTILSLDALKITQSETAHFHISRIRKLNPELITELNAYDYIVTVEDGCIQGGMGYQLGHALVDCGYKGKITHLGIPDRFIPHGSNEELYEYCGFSPAQIAQHINNLATKL